jgi:hypothetical protein
MDKYNRPVVYANLFGQDRVIGQYVMSVNYYFSSPHTVESRQPSVARSARHAQEAGLPCIFSEYNCWYGPVYSQGAAAVRGLYEYGVDRGMQGGFFYQLREDPDRHPGIVVNDTTLWTNPTLVAALQQAFADATVRTLGRTDADLRLEICNRRPFSLRDIRYEVRVGRFVLVAGEMDHLGPAGKRSLLVPTEDSSGDQVYDVHLHYETHYGIRNHIVKRLYIEAD